MANPFEVRRDMREHKPREDHQPEPVRTAPTEGESGGLEALLPKKRKSRSSQSYAFYLPVELMDRVRRTADRLDVPISQLVAACIKKALDEMEE